LSGKGGKKFKGCPPEGGGLLKGWKRNITLQEGRGVQERRLRFLLKKRKCVWEKNSSPGIGEGGGVFGGWRGTYSERKKERGKGTPQKQARGIREERSCIKTATKEVAHKKKQ